MKLYFVFYERNYYIRQNYVSSILFRYKHSSPVIQPI